MIKVNVHDAKTHFSEYVKRAMKGETILVCKRNLPVAELRGLQPEARKTRRLGFYKGKTHIPPEFWDPLPQEFQDYFDGKK